MCLIGDAPELGEWKATPYQMNKSTRNNDWLVEKYGDLVQPYEIIIKFKQ